MAAATWDSISLRDGTRVQVRPIERSDLELERRFVAGLSARTGYLRLLSMRKPTSAELERWTAVDPAREIAIVAIATVGGTEQEIGVARCAVDDDEPSRWDFAIVVADACQGRGLGEAMLQLLIERADGSGVPALSSIVLAENRGMLALARKLGFTVRPEPGGATVMRVERRRPAA